MTKKQAVAEQIDQAIRLWREGYIASAVTLAGAAESSMQDPATGETLFDWLKVAGMESLKLDEKRVVADHLNYVRNWLKHICDDDIELKPVEGFLMLARAYSKFIMLYGQDAQTDAMRGMIEEIGSSIRQFLQPFLNMLTKLGSIPGDRAPPLPLS